MSDLSDSDADGTNARHDIIGILVFGSAGKLSGERVYAGNNLIELVFGLLLGRSLATPLEHR